MVFLSYLLDSLMLNNADRAFLAPAWAEVVLSTPGIRNSARSPFYSFPL